jgi:hypothetical protein
MHKHRFVEDFSSSILLCSSLVRRLLLRSVEWSRLIAPETTSNYSRRSSMRAVLPTNLNEGFVSQTPGLLDRQVSRCMR